jgi:hypothetical protein
VPPICSPNTHRDRLWRCSVPPPNVELVYSRLPTRDFPVQDPPGISRTVRETLATSPNRSGFVPRCGLAFAVTMVPSTVRRLPSTNPASKQRRTISSKTSRKTPTLRNRPCRFLEKVEWSGISRSNPSLLNQRYAKCIRTSSIKRLSLVIPYR